MNPFDVLDLGHKYSKRDLADLLDQPNVSNVREGVYTCTNSSSYLLFVDLEKKGKEERFHFDDFFEEDFFHWDSQTTQHIDSPKIQDILNGDLTPHLFVRITPKIKGVTQPFVYCGRLVYSTHEENTSKPVHIVFQSTDYDDFTENEDLVEIYLWRPSKVGKTTKSKISKKGEISTTRRSKYKRPNITERTGLVTSRVGQGYFRQQIIEKWGGQCPISGIDILPILISSHIIPWSESNDQERLDVENGILLSPLYDALFDKHLISFEDDGKIVISERLKGKNIHRFSINEETRINVSKGMVKYLARHRATLKKLSNA